MKVAIIGPGALGCLLAARFKLAGEEVRLVDYRPERAEDINRRGLLLRTPEGEETVIQVPTSLASEVGAADLAILTVKAHQTRAAAQSLPQLLSQGGMALTLQNGLGNVEEMARVVGSENLLAGVTILGATLAGVGKVFLAGLGPTYVGGPPHSQVSPADIEAVVALFQRAGLTCAARDDIEVVMWEKLIVNVGINPLTALLRIPNGKLLEIQPAWKVAVAAAAEVLTVARACGINLAVDPESRLQEVCTATAANRSSMLQDVLAGRRTEIEALNAQVAARGERHGVPTPINIILTQLLRALEAASGVAGGGG